MADAFQWYLIPIVLLFYQERLLISPVVTHLNKFLKESKMITWKTIAAYFWISGLQRTTKN